MVRLKITPKNVLAVASAMMVESRLPEPIYNFDNGLKCRAWFDRRNAIADQIMHQGGIS